MWKNNSESLNNKFISQLKIILFDLKKTVFCPIFRKKKKKKTLHIKMKWILSSAKKEDASIRKKNYKSTKEYFIQSKYVVFTVFTRTYLHIKEKLFLNSVKQNSESHH